MGRPPIKATGAMTNAEHQRRWRRKLARLKKLANPKLVAKQTRRAAREAELAAKITSLPDAKFSVILADPEWRMEFWSRETGMNKAADNHFSTSPTEVIKARDVASIAAIDAVLFLWAIAPMLDDAIDVMRGWGFKYRSRVVWRKPHIGMGFWFRFQHELLLVGTRGEISCPAPGTQWPSIVEAPVGVHSEKPEIFYEMIEAYFPNLPKIELNARKRPPGWSSWGTLEHEPTEAAQ